MGKEGQERGGAGEAQGGGSRPTPQRDRVLVRGQTRRPGETSAKREGHG